MNGNDGSPDPVEAWLDVAEADLRSAVTLADLDPPELEQAAFHAQQAGEKYLKALLTHHGRDTPRTHDLEVLVDLLSDVESNLDDLRDAAALPTPYAVAARYPFTPVSPTEHEVRDALEAARDVRGEVERRTS